MSILTQMSTSSPYPVNAYVLGVHTEIHSRLFGSYLKILKITIQKFVMNIEKRFFSEIERQFTYSPERNAVSRTLLWFLLENLRKVF